jgi:hypothetical protein
MIKRPNGKTQPNEHLKEYLKSSYEERLNWLEEAIKFANLALTNKKKKFREKVRKGLIK